MGFHKLSPNRDWNESLFDPRRPKSLRSLFEESSELLRTAAMRFERP